MLATSLTACGTPASPSWTGGEYGRWEPNGYPTHIVILHQGHDCFDGCRYDDSLIPAAELFSANGALVVGMEMPPEPHEAGPIESYYEPVIRLIDELTAEYPGVPISIAGLSGGGWTASVVTALDARIYRGYSVEGDPVSSDWEQQNLPHDYPTLYAMAGYRLMHIYIPASSSDCTGWSYPYPCVNDLEATGHYVSTFAVGYMLRDLGMVH